MRTRIQLQKRINQYVDYAAVPLEYHDMLHDKLDDYILTQSPNSSEIIRYLAKMPEMDYPGILGLESLPPFPLKRLCKL